MAAEAEVKEVASKKKGSPARMVSTLKRVDPETAKAIQAIKDKANKKQFGRRVRDAEIIALAIKQITGEHIKELQDATLSENDKLRMLHDDYQKTNGKISLDQFIGKLLRGELSQPKAKAE